MKLALPPVRGEPLLLAAILIALSILRFSLDSGPGPYGVDSSYYAQVARNVAAGRGLVTNVELYHQGLDPLPAPTNIYPLWPLLLGALGRLGGMLPAIHHLPRALYLVALATLYLMARRIAPRAQKIYGPFTVAHLAVVLFGLTPQFFRSTTYPYTEALAFTLAGATLLTSFGRSWQAALGGGVLAGLATLTRSQMLMLVVGVVVARGYEAIRQRRWGNVALSASGVAIVLVPWLSYVSTFTGSFAIRHLYVIYHQATAFPPYTLGVPTGGIAEAMLLRMKGILTAFNPASNDSFIALYGAVALLVPVAAVHWLHRVFRSPSAISAGVLAVALSGTLLSMMLAWLPQSHFRAWLFGWRHGLPFILLIILAVVELVGYGHRYVRLGVLAIAFISVASGGAHVVRAVLEGPPGGPTRAERELSAWLERQPPPTVVLTTRAQELSMYSHVNFRWAACDDPPSTTAVMLEHVKTDYVAIYESQRQCTIGRGIEHLVEPVAQFGVEPNRILLLRRRF